MEKHGLIYLFIDTTIRFGIPIFLFLLYHIFRIGLFIYFLIFLLLSPFYILKFLMFVAGYLLEKVDKKWASSSSSSYQQSYTEQEHCYEEEPPASEPHGSDESNDPYRLIGVRSNASREEIKKAYRLKMSMNHLDKLATLDPALQKIAKQRSVSINNAYEQLMREVA
jgi:DnaJ-domain-containing protein 1